jgi:DNA-binding PadR family transcriptional regulator
MTPVTSPAGDDALPAIPATAWAVLGLLSFERELSGYDIKQWADSILRFFYWSPATSQIYAELRRLEDLGLVVSHVVARDDVRGKRLYAITPAGRGALERWQVDTEPEATVLKHGLMLRLWLGHLAPPERLREQVEAHQVALRAELEAARASAESASTEPEWAYPSLVARWTCRRIEDELALTDEMLADLDGLTTSLTSTSTDRTRIDTTSIDTTTDGR